MKKVLSLILCVCLLFVCVACNGADKTTSDGQNNAVKVEKAKEVLNFDNKNNVIVCWGDNITQGVAMAKGFTYPQQLQGSIGSQYRVLNAGVPGEMSDAILSRANAIEFCLSIDVIFDKGEAQYTMDRNLFTEKGADIPLAYKGFGNEVKLSNVIIGGKPYTIEFETGDAYDNGIYRLTRKDTSKALTIPAGTKVKFDYSSQFDKIYCNIILIGANDGNVDAATIIKKYKKLTALNEKYIVIIPFYSSDYSKEFKEAFGEKALDLREYMMKQAHKDYGVELNKLDEACIRKGMIPGAYNYQTARGSSDLNELGYKILADQVYKKGVELGYWK